MTEPPQRGPAEQNPGPPEPPSMQRRMRVRWQQALGLAVLAIGPIAALAGALDEHEHFATRSVGPLSVHVSHVDRVRQNRYGRVNVELDNGGDAPLAIEVAISPEYFDGADSVQMTPPPVRAWATRLERLEPGEEVRVEIEYRAELGGWYEGTLRIRAVGLGDGSVHEERVPLATYVHF